MHLKGLRAELEFLRQRVSRLLGEPVRLFDLDYDLRTILLRLVRCEGTAGLGEEAPVQTFRSGTQGWTIGCGVIRYSVAVGNERIEVVHIHNPFSNDQYGLINDFWGISKRCYSRLYRFLRRTARDRLARVLPPIMSAVEQQRLWENTIGFLRRGEEALQRFGVVLKRGLLLTGEPGNGKTLAARWLQAQAQKHDLEWRSVSAEEYEMARCEGEARELFRLERPGLILFDDFDSALHNRDQNNSPVDSSTFLCELDGVDIRSGVIYLFTSNTAWERLDPAFRRPGRIDCVFRFDRPNADLRRRLILERWPAEMVSEIPVESAVGLLEGRSFAEIEEARKLLVIHYLETGKWDWSRASGQLADREKGAKPGRPIGFSAVQSEAPQRHVAACVAEGI